MAHRNPFHWRSPETATSADSWCAPQVRGNCAVSPQAALRQFHSATFPTGDPVQVAPNERVAAATLRLRAGEHLPLRTFDDRELDAHGASGQSDPLLGILGALADLPTGWRALCQLIVLGPAPHNWARAFQRLALERPLDQERLRPSL